MTHANVQLTTTPDTDVFDRAIGHLAQAGLEPTLVLEWCDDRLAA